MFRKINCIYLLYILLIWIFPYPPLGDFANHLASIHIIGQIQDGNEFLTGFFSYDLFKPAIFPTLIILFLSNFFPVLISAKIFLSLYIVIFAFSFDYFFKNFFKRDYDYLLVLGSLFAFNIFFYFGLMGFSLSIPLFFLFFTYLYKNKDDYLIFSIAVFLLCFIHLFTAILLVFAIVFFDPSKLKKKEFYIALIPVIIINLFWILGNMQTQGEAVDIFDYFKNTYLNGVVRKIIFLFQFSYFGVFGIFLIFAHLAITKIKIKRNKFLMFAFVLFVLFAVLPEDLPKWQMLATRFIPFVCFFIIIGLPKIENKVDLKFIKYILIAFFIINIGVNAHSFYQFNSYASDFDVIKENIKENSSIECVFTPKRTEADISGISPFLHSHHYVILEKKSVYSSDLFSYGYNPLKIEKEMPGDFSKFKFYPDDGIWKNCTRYQNYYEEVKKDKDYPYYDYILLLENDCNVTDYFVGEYRIAYENRMVLLEKIN